MTEKERKEALTAIKKVGKRVNASPASARRFLVKAGILTKNGRLAKAYKTSKS